MPIGSSKAALIGASGAGDGGGETLPTVLEDHESGDTVATLYDGDTGDFSNENDTTVEGDWNILHTGGGGGSIGHTSATVERGFDYECVTYHPAGGRVNSLMAVQDSANPMANNYYAEVRVGNNELRLNRRSTTTSNAQLGTATTSAISGPLIVKFVWAWDVTGATDNLVVSVLDDTDTTLGTVTATDDEHEGGTFGWWHEFTDDVRFDTVTKQTLS